jgi:hypothetical protein
MNARAIVDQAGATVAEGTQYIGTSTGSYYFTGPAEKVSPSDVPYPPAGSAAGQATTGYG